MRREKMRIKVCKIWKAVVCLLFAAWCSFSLFQTGFLRRGGDVFQQQQQQPQPDDFDNCQSSNGSCDKSIRTDISVTTKTPSSTTSTTSATPTAAHAVRSVEIRKLAREQLGKWQREAVPHCSTNVVTLPASGFARLHRVIIDPRRARGKLGGENVLEVLNQPEASEFWTLNSGAFLVLCPNRRQPGSDLTVVAEPPRGSRPHRLYRQFLSATRAVDRDEFARLAADAEPLDGPVLAVVRNEYANLYHTVSQIYNAFANAIFFGIDPAEATVLLIDGHPKSSLDPMWHTLFRKVIRMGQLQSRPRALSDLVWVAEGHDSPLLENRHSLPLLNHFREFFLAHHGFNATRSPSRSTAPAQRGSSSPIGARNCSGLQVVLIWRRDYVAHPRNPAGRVVRKIANENQLLEEVRYAFPRLRLNVTGIAMESLSFQEQLNLVSDTQVLIGMHGAGLTHGMFLPEGSGLIELFPDLWSQENYHFRSIAAWRGLAYEQWTSGGGDGDSPITVPRGIVGGLLHGLLSKMHCKMN